MIYIFKVTVNSENIQLVDALLEAEYFASLCGFEYPNSKLYENSKKAKLYLKASMSEDKTNPRIKYGLMVWHNTNYIPEIELRETNKGIQLRISNEYSLPYPAIKRTEAWLKGLEDHLTKKATGAECIAQSKRIFLMNIQQG